MMPSESKPEEIYSHFDPLKICVRFVDEMIGLDVANELLNLLRGRNLEIGRSEITFTMKYAGELTLLLCGIYSGDELGHHHMSFGLDSNKELLVIELEYN